ncbi:MAG TPA: hypothetical protein VFZ48_02990 [Candidatus Saccharimonadales bacterium]
MTERYRPIPDVLREPGYFEQREIAETNRLIDAIMIPAHERCGNPSVASVLHNKGLRRVTSTATVQQENGESYLERTSFVSAPDQLSFPERYIFTVGYEKRNLIAKTDLAPGIRGYISGAFEQQYSQGVITPEQIMHIRETMDVWYVERDLYTIRPDQQVQRGFSVRAEVRHADTQQRMGVGYDTAWIAGSENDITDPTLIGDAELVPLRSDLNEGLLLGANTYHEARILHSLLRLKLITEDEVRRYAGPDVT